MNLIKNLAMTSALSSMNRYAQTSLCRPESVLEHMGHVCMFALIIGNEINRIVSDEHEAREPIIDIAVLMSKATCHDLDEIVTGEVPRTTKYFDEQTRDMFRKIALDGIVRVINELGYNHENGVGFEIFRSWLNAKQGREGCIVVLADLNAVIYKIWDEVLLRHNHTMVTHAIKIQEQLRLATSIVKTNFESYPSAHRSLEELIQEMTSIAMEAATYDRPIYGTFHKR